MQEQAEAKKKALTPALARPAPSESLGKAMAGMAVNPPPDDYIPGPDDHDESDMDMDVDADPDDEAPR